MNAASHTDTVRPAARYRIENIEARRASLGIDDEELRGQVRSLKAGDRVCLTLCAGEATQSGEVVEVAITAVGADSFRGVLTGAPKAQALAGLHAGAVIQFTAAQVHSVVDEHPIPCVPRVRPAK